MRRFVVAGLVVALIALAGCSAAPKPAASDGGGAPAGKMPAGSARVSDGDGGGEVTLTVGGTLVVDLEENATTGFSWAPRDPSPDVLTLSSDEQKAAEATGVVGAAGRHIFTFTAAKTGSGDLTLDYVRPWEKGVAPAKSFTVKVTVD